MYLDPYYFIRDSKKFQKKSSLFFSNLLGFTRCVFENIFFQRPQKCQCGIQTSARIYGLKSFRENMPKTLVLIIEIRAPDPLLTGLQDSGI
jgi:hypothetical protein